MAKVRLLDPSDPKRRLDRYELIGELASGGMATVYLGRLGGVGGFQRLVAVKQLYPHLAREQEFIEMFLDEARLAAGIHHPHVVPILEVGESTRGYYLVMEYVEGDTLAHLLSRAVARGQPMPEAVLIRIVLDALAGLHAAHELSDPRGFPVRLVHRDVSPQNVLVGVDGCSRITDFGVAHVSLLHDTRTPSAPSVRPDEARSDRLKGKLAYMAPEQARAGDVDRRADLFAMGIILWEGLAGRRLFKSESDAVTLQRVAVDPIPRVSDVAPSVHAALDHVCQKALERDPDRRYRSAAEMAQALERAARTAARAAPTPEAELGVAGPREVAAYVTEAIGDDLAAQRESVRAWLQQHDAAELEAPRSAADGRPAGYNVTFKMPLDELRETAPALPSSRVVINPRAAMTADGASVDEAPVEPSADDEDDHETLLMERDPPSSLAARPQMDRLRRGAYHFVDESTSSASIGSLTVVRPTPRANHTPHVVATVVAILVALGGFAVLSQRRTEHADDPRTAASAPDKPAPPEAPPRAETATEAATPAEEHAAAPPAEGAPPAPKGHAPRGKPAPAPPAAAPAAAPASAKPADDMANPYR